MNARVVITAGASGIGKAMADAFIARGDRVAITDIDEDAISQFKRTYPETIAEIVDVTDALGMSGFFARVVSQWGGVDVVCANAGTGGPAGPIEELDLDAWKACVEVNLFGSVTTAQQAAKIMKTQGSGSIIFTSSTSGLHGVPMRSPYVAAKWALIGLMKTMAMELGPYGVRVNAICPGAVEGDRMERVLQMEATARGINTEDVRTQYAKGVSLRSWVKPEDIAAMATFLASENGKMISGQALAIDGHTESMV